MITREHPSRAGRPRLARLVAVLALAGCRAAALDPGAEAVVRGPLPTRAQHPLALAFLGMPSRRATPVPAGRTEALLSIAYTSLYEVNGGSGQRVAFDGEIARPSLRLRRGLDDESDLEIELAGLYATSGFLDDFVTSFHELLHFADGGRSIAQDDQYAMFLRNDGKRVFEVEEDQLSFADVPIVWTRRLRHETASSPALALRVGIELPTGSLERGSGNEELDYGAGLLAEKSFGRFTVTGSLDWIHPERPDTFVGTGADMDELLVVQNGWEYRWSARTSLLGVLSWTSPMTSDWSFEEIDREILDLGLGFARDLWPGARFLLSFHEDLVAATGADFTLFSGLALSF